MNKFNSNNNMCAFYFYKLVYIATEKLRDSNLLFNDKNFTWSGWFLKISF